MVTVHLLTLDSKLTLFSFITTFTTIMTRNALSSRFVTLLLWAAVTTSAFQVPGPEVSSKLALMASQHDPAFVDHSALISRRSNLQHMGLSLFSLGVPVFATVETAGAEDFAARDAQRQYVQESYEDFTKSKDGWLYREVKPGKGEMAKEGDKVVFEWSGYTIGYFGRPFQAKGSVKFFCYR